MKKVKLGLVGAGWVAKQHLDVISAIDWIEAAGITSRTRSKAEELAKQYAIPVVSDDLDALVRSTQPDALMVLVKEDQMCKVVAAAMKYKLPLFVEKPAGLIPEENLKLAKLAAEQGISTMVGFNRRYYSIFQKGVEIIKEHGRLLGVQIDGHERIWRVHESKAFSEQIIGNWLYANSTHTIDILRYFGGEVKGLCSIAHKYKEPLGDQFAAVMELGSGAIGQYNAHWYSPGGWRVVLYGEGVTVEFKPLEKGFWTGRDLKTTEIMPDEVDSKYKMGFYRQMEAFGHFVLTGTKKWPMVDLADSYKTMQLAREIASGARSN